MSCKKEHNCLEIMDKVYLALDGALSQEELIDFQEELDRCSHCLETYQIEAEFKQFLATKIQRKPDCSRLIEEIRKSIQLKPV